METTLAWQRFPALKSIDGPFAEAGGDPAAGWSVDPVRGRVSLLVVLDNISVHHCFKNTGKICHFRNKSNFLQKWPIPILV